MAALKPLRLIKPFLSLIPADVEGDIIPLSRAMDLSGRPLDPVDGAIGYRTNKAGRRVLVDCLGSEIRKGSRRPIGRVSTEEWNKLSSEEKEAWDEKLKG